MGDLDFGKCSRQVLFLRQRCKRAGRTCAVYNTDSLTGLLVLRRYTNTQSKTVVPLKQRQGEVGRIGANSLHATPHLRLQIVVLGPHVVPDVQRQQLWQARDALSNLLLSHANLPQVLQLLLHPIYTIVQHLQASPMHACLWLFHACLDKVAPSTCRNQGWKAGPQQQTKCQLLQQ